jgi:hypothetical protein
METGNLDRDKEFSVVDSTEEFETPETTNTDTYEPAVTDFETQEQPSEVPSDSDFAEPQDVATETPISQDVSEPSTVEIATSMDQEKTPSQQSFRVMRFEDFVNRSGN